MCWRTRWTTRSRTARGDRSASSSCAGELCADDFVPEEMAVGERRRLADVVEQRREPDDRPIDARGVDRADACDPRGPRPETLFWGTPRWRASSGAIRSSSPVSASSRSPTDGRSAASSFDSSVEIRSPDR